MMRCPAGGKAAADALWHVAESKQMANNEDIHNAFIHRFVRTNSAAVKAGMISMRKKGLVPGNDAYLSYGLAVGLASGNWEKVIYDMRLRGVLGVNEWAALIRELSPTEGVEMYKIMQKENITPNLDVFHGLIEAHSHKPKFEVSPSYPPKGVFDEMKRLGIEPTAKTYELLSTLGKVDSVTLKKMYIGMQKRGIQPTIRTLVKWVEHFSLEGDWQWCNQLWEEAEPRLDEFEQGDYAILLQAFSTSNNPTSTVKILDKILQANLLEATLGYNYILSALAKQGDAAGCKQFLARMEKERHKPTPETFEYMVQVHLTAHTNTGNREELSQVFHYDREIRARRLFPTRSTYRYVLAAHARAGDASGANRLLDLLETSEKILKVDMEDYHVLFNNAIKSADVKKWLVDCKKKFPIEFKGEVPETDGILLRAYARTQDEAAAIAVYNLMSNEERKAQGAHDAMLTMYCKNSSHVANVRNILNDARNDGVQLQNDTYDELVVYFAKESDKTHVQELVEEMTQLGYQLGDVAARSLNTMVHSAKLADTLLAELMEKK